MGCPLSLLLPPETVHRSTSDDHDNVISDRQSEAVAPKTPGNSLTVIQVSPIRAFSTVTVQHFAADNDEEEAEKGSSSANSSSEIGAESRPSTVSTTLVADVDEPKENERKDDLPSEKSSRDEPASDDDDDDDDDDETTEGSMCEVQAVANLDMATTFEERSSLRLKNPPPSVDTSRARSNADVLSRCIRQLGLVEYPQARSDGQPCDVYWHNVFYPDLPQIGAMSPRSAVNKMPGMTELARKGALTQALMSMQQLFPAHYSFYPRSWFLPAERDFFQRHCDVNTSPKTWYIVKPDEGSQGTGIYLVQSPAQIQESSPQIVQEYVSDPMLLDDGLKFDLRVYAVIRSLSPLAVYVAREGMARFCTSKYSAPSQSNALNAFVHLTNYSLNKESRQYKHSETLQQQFTGSKRLLSTVFLQLAKRGVDTRRLWKEIKLLIVRTAIALLPELVIQHEHTFGGKPAPRCFHIVGFDILLRSDGSPVLLEVNAAPSLSLAHDEHDALSDSHHLVSSIVDEAIKVPLVRDTLLLALGRFDDHYHCDLSLDTTLSSTASSTSIISNQSAALSRRPYLVEVFPGRYGAENLPLLVLDRVAYLFMQITSIHQSLVVSHAGLKTFVRKCSLQSIVSVDQLEAMAAEVTRHMTTDSTDALSFQGFVRLLFRLSSRFSLSKDGDASTDLPSNLNALLTHCECSLRRCGVRSSRLRRLQTAGSSGRPGRMWLLPARSSNGGSAAVRSRSSTSLSGSRRRRFEGAPPTTRTTVSFLPAVY